MDDSRRGACDRGSGRGVRRRHAAAEPRGGPGGTGLDARGARLVPGRRVRARGCGVRCGASRRVGRSGGVRGAAGASVRRRSGRVGGRRGHRVCGRRPRSGRRGPGFRAAGPGGPRAPAVRSARPQGRAELLGVVVRVPVGAAALGGAARGTGRARLHVAERVAGPPGGRRGAVDRGGEADAPRGAGHRAAGGRAVPGVERAVGGVGGRGRAGGASERHAVPVGHVRGVHGCAVGPGDGRVAPVGSGG